MTYSDKYKFIFIAIPKTSTTFIQNHLEKFGTRSQLVWYKNHAIIPWIKKDLGETRWNNYFKFTFVRNPWDRSVSLYHWKPQAKKYKNFQEWNLKTTHDNMYHKFIFDEKDKICVDFIGYFENLKNDFTKICKKIGIPEPKNFNKVNTQNRPQNYKKFYTNKKQIQRVRDLYTKTIDLLGYKF